jgi:hypothetical protein
MDPKPVEDDAGAQATIRDAQQRRVPDELVHQLHEANAVADDLRRRLQATVDDSEYDHAGRSSAVGDALRKAEAEIERVSSAIREASPGQAKV